MIMMNIIGSEHTRLSLRMISSDTVFSMLSDMDRLRRLTCATSSRKRSAIYVLTKFMRSKEDLLTYGEHFTGRGVVQAKAIRTVLGSP